MIDGVVAEIVEVVGIVAVGLFEAVDVAGAEARIQLRVLPASVVMAAAPPHTAPLVDLAGAALELCHLALSNWDRRSGLMLYLARELSPRGHSTEYSFGVQVLALVDLRYNLGRWRCCSDLPGSCSHLSFGIDGFCYIFR